MLSLAARRSYADDVVAGDRFRAPEGRVRDLKRMLGRKTLEVDSFEDALDLAAPKKPPLRLGSFDRDDFP